MTKICNSCETEKPLEAFHTYKTGRKAGKYRGTCIECIRIANTRWYEANKEKLKQKDGKTAQRKAEVQKHWRSLHKAELAAYAQQRRSVNWEKEYKLRRAKTEEQRCMLKDIKEQPCKDCGNSYPPFVMEFDHRDPLTKKFEIGNAIAAGTRSWKTIKEEIDKCDLVCANCHRIRTAKSLGWYEGLYDVIPIESEVTTPESLAA